MEKVELIRLSEAAKIAAAHPDSIRRWTDDGELTDYRTSGNHRRVDRKELRELLEARRKFAEASKKASGGKK